MGRASVMAGVLVCAGLLGGCRAPTRMATRVTEVPRVDLELGGGNRGFLLGTPPEARPQKTTRQILQTDIEIPSFYRPKRGAGSQVEEIAPPEVEAPAAMEDAGAAALPEGPYDTYVVQKGDSLWSIAKKHYGKATHWRRIFEANRDVLKNSDQVKVGMTLKIPRGEPAGGETTYDDEGITYKK